MDGNYNRMPGVCPWWDQMKAQQWANGQDPAFVMPGLVPGIHAFLNYEITWMAGTSPAMTSGESLP